MITVVLSGFVVAEDTAEVTDLTTLFTSLKSEYLNQSLEGPLGGVLGNERITFFIETSNGVQAFHVITEKKVVIEMDVGEVEDTTLEVFSSQETITEIMTAENQYETFQTALREKKITYNAVGVGKKVKFAFSRMMLKIADLFR